MPSKAPVCPTCNGTGQAPDHAAVGAELKRRRLVADLTLRQLAALVGCTNGFISDLEHGRKHGNGAWPRRVGEILGGLEEQR